MKHSQNKRGQTSSTAAYNGRFGASGAVARPKVCANLQVSFPSERQCKPRLRQAAGTLAAMRRQRRRVSTVPRRKYNPKMKWTKRKFKLMITKINDGKRS